MFIKPLMASCHFLHVQVTERLVSELKNNAHTHTHTLTQSYIYVYIHIYM